jgi:hypothetical protein
LALPLEAFYMVLVNFSYADETDLYTLILKYIASLFGYLTGLIVFVFLIKPLYICLDNCANRCCVKFIELLSGLISIHIFIGSLVYIICLFIIQKQQLTLLIASYLVTILLATLAYAAIWSTNIKTDINYYFKRERIK